MLVFPNAKINLGLNVIEKRNDGYHNIETIFYPIGLSDALEIVPAQNKKEVTLFISGIEMEGDLDQNLVVKAYRLLNNQIKLTPVAIYLHKKIPFGAGLGGGSSDAAYTLKILNKLFDCKLVYSELEALAASLGADCAFFVRNSPVFASGIGNVFEPINISLKNYTLVLVKPDIFVSTPAAYASIIPHKPIVSLKDVINYPIEEWKQFMVNDFETPVFAKYPRIKQIKDNLYDLGAVYAAMSGSGSSVFGIFRDNELNFDKIFPNEFVWSGKIS